MYGLVLRIFVIILGSIGFLEPAFPDEASSSGTGFAVSNDGWVLTNAHVVEGCERIEVVSLGKAIDIRKDGTNDLALIKVDTDLALKPLAFRRNITRLGEDIIALGYPLDQVLSDSIKMTTGNVSSLSGLGNDTRFLQISTPIQPGNSGGPIVDRSGYVVGITTSALSKKFSDQIGFTAQNVNFAIRIMVADLFLQAQGITAPYDLDGKIENSDLSTADIAEATSPSVFKILCYTTPKPVVEATNQTAAPAFNPSTNQSFLIHQNNYDAIGFDYDIARNVSYDQCTSICEQTTRCAAITWHKRFRSCMLKTDVVALIKNNDAAASYKSYKAKDVFLSSFTAYSGFDIPGGDYARKQRSNYLECFLACIGDNQCKAFSYLPKKKECWLKNSLGQPQAMKNVELGIK
ncbi:trypsin-like peptidase domain-containing protein [Bartonella sp. HY761]|uniref:trypsin-like peptidase domain-containing protein n=1 Tax=Bartonella sp. HY761 TaxID=2979330 RepID=UPI002200B841|nr:trypsin-like peptidase domain-containing protein [Bartonella sp. HY761]UXN06390.1 trypsin-like peptidase domain-containing protein [Bartonella sp. HY761]